MACNLPNEKVFINFFGKPGIMKFKFATALTGLLAGLALLTTVSAQADDSLSAIIAKKSISLGIATDFPPYGFMGPDFKPPGLDVAVAQLIADKLGVKAEMTPVSTPNRIPYLQTRKIDLIAGASKALFEPEAGRPGLPLSSGRNAVLPGGTDISRFEPADRIAGDAGEVRLRLTPEK